MPDLLVTAIVAFVGSFLGARGFFWLKNRRANRRFQRVMRERASQDVWPT